MLGNHNSDFSIPITNFKRWLRTCTATFFLSSPCFKLNLESLQTVFIAPYRAKYPSVSCAATRTTMRTRQLTKWPPHCHIGRLLDGQIDSHCCRRVDNSRIISQYPRCTGAIAGVSTSLTLMLP